MTMLEQPTYTYKKSEIRKREVIEHAQDALVEIVVGGSQESLFLLSGRRLRTFHELNQFSTLYVRMTVELGRADPSPAILGDVGYIASWSAAERRNFADGFAEALAEAIRLNDPTIVRTYITMMSETAPAGLDRPDFTGDLSDEASARLAARFSS